MLQALISIFMHRIQLLSALPDGLRVGLCAGHLKLDESPSPPSFPLVVRACPTPAPAFAGAPANHAPRPAASIGPPADTSASLALPLAEQNSDEHGWTEVLLTRAVKPEGKREGLVVQVPTFTNACSLLALQVSSPLATLTSDASRRTSLPLVVRACPVSAAVCVGTLVSHASLQGLLPALVHLQTSAQSLLCRRLNKLLTNRLYGHFADTCSNASGNKEIVFRGLAFTNVRVPLALQVQWDPPRWRRRQTAWWPLGGGS